MGKEPHFQVSYSGSFKDAAAQQRKCEIDFRPHVHESVANTLVLGDRDDR